KREVYKAEKRNSEPVSVWKDSNNKERFDTDRRFVFSRFVNGIQVSNNEISITVDSNNVVTNYSTSHTENITFPDADIISTDEAFKKLYEQRDFNKYYNGWITKDGTFKTYLLYDIDGFYLNAKTGKLCNWDGDTVTASDSGDVSYSDIKDIPQREAILELQKYGVTLSADGKKFRPNDAISEADFGNLLAAALNGAYAYEYAIPDVEEVEDEALAKDVAETTRREAAVMFANIYDNNGIADLKGIYRSFYSDVKSSDENAGHIAIAYAKGFFGKTADGQFHGDKVITRAEAMQLVYDYLKLLSK
ncbi:MAG: S-layer homology domain-containing protein, partial [Oscillospiraceae bacterium]|nr:S-layer homology domain-containing protein [Oscillospiraceae bacterium]